MTCILCRLWTCVGAFEISTWLITAWQPSTDLHQHSSTQSHLWRNFQEVQLQLPSLRLYSSCQQGQRAGYWKQPGGESRKESLVIHSSLRILHAWRLKVKLSWETKISQFFYNLRKKKKRMHTHSNMDYQTKTRLSWSPQRSSRREIAMASSDIFLMLLIWEVSQLFNNFLALKSLLDHFPQVISHQRRIKLHSAFCQSSDTHRSKEKVFTS